MPSILSKKPPWPGKIFPVSFNLAFLLKKEIIRSPIWLTNEINKISKIINIRSVSKRILLFCPKYFIKINPNNNEMRKLPITPEYVFFGLTLVNLGPLKVFPKIYPPISVNIQTIIKNRKKFKPIYCLKQTVEKKEKNKKNNPKILIRSFFFVILNHSKLVAKKIKLKKNIKVKDP